MDGSLIYRDDASSGQAVQETAYSAFDGGRIIAAEPVEQAMRDQAIYVDRAYFKDCAPIPALTAIPETRHADLSGAGLTLYRRVGQLWTAV